MGLRETKTPDIPTVPEAKGALARFIQAVTETLQVREGRRGDQLDQAVTYRDLVAGGIVTMRGIGQVGGRTGGLAFTPVAGGDDLDLTPPPLLTGLKATPGLKTVFVQWDAPLYQQGHGPAHVEVWGAPYSGTGPLPTFGNAVLLDRVQGVLYPHQVQHGTTWHYWARNVTVDGVAQTSPTGGTNGVSATAGIDIDAALTDLIAAMSDPDATGTPLVVQAGRFYVAPETDHSQEAEPGSPTTGQTWFQPSTRIYRRWNGSTWEAFPPAVPFIVNTAPITEDGRTIPAGVYMDAAYIRNVSALIARFGDASIDNALIASLDAAKLTAGDGTIGGVLKSQNYIAGSIGWRIHRDGTAEFSNLIARGTVYATAGEIGGNSIKTDAVHSPHWITGGYGWRLGSDGVVKMVSSGGSRIFDLGASGTQPVLKIGDVLEVLANGTASFGGSVTATEVKGGFTSWAWPASGGGYYLGPNGLRLGRYDSGAYLDVRSNGDLYGPAFDVVAGVMTLKQANVIEAINLAGNAVNVSNSVSGTGASISTSVTVPAGKTWSLVGLGYQEGASVIGSPYSNPYSADLTLMGASSSPAVTQQDSPSGVTARWTASGVSVMAMVSVTGPATYTATLSGTDGLKKTLILFGAPT